MNTIPPNLEEAGLVAYEQARAFEAVQQRQLPLIYGALTLLLVAAGLVMMKFENPVLATVCFAAAIGFPCIAWLNWQRLKARHATNLNFLADLEGKYGERLPWIQVERHLAALAEVQRELDEEQKRN